jgi:hypothetical protein
VLLLLLLLVVKVTAAAAADGVVAMVFLVSRALGQSQTTKQQMQKPME